MKRWTLVLANGSELDAQSAKALPGPDGIPRWTACCELSNGEQCSSGSQHSEGHAVLALASALILAGFPMLREVHPHTEKDVNEQTACIDLRFREGEMHVWYGDAPPDQIQTAIAYALAHTKKPKAGEKNEHDTFVLVTHPRDAA